jgi:MFS family permease
VSQQALAAANRSQPKGTAKSTFWSGCQLGIYGLGLMALWNTVNTLVLQDRVEATAPASWRGSALGIVSLVGIGLATLVQPFAGRLSDSLDRDDRRRPFIVVGTIAALPCLALFAWAPGFWTLLLGYVGMQIALNVAQAAFQAFIPDLVDSEDRGTASGAKNVLSVAGAAVGLLGAEGLQSLGAGTGLVVIYLAAVLVASAWLTVRWVPKSPRSPMQRMTALDALNPRQLWSTSLKTFREHRVFTLAVTAQFLFLFGTYPAQRFLLFLLKDRFGAEKASQRASIGLVAAIIFAALAAVIAGFISDRIGRVPVLIVTVILGIIGMVGVGIGPTPFWVGMAGVCLATGVGAFQAVNWALLSDDIDEGEGARAFGLANVATAGAGALAGLFGPLVDLVDRVLPGGAYGVTFSLASVFVAISLIPLLQIGKQHNVKEGTLGG